MIELKNLNKSYQLQKTAISALTNINLKVGEAEIFGIIGKSGAGKSSLIRCVNLLERPSSGEVWVNGQNLLSLNPELLRLARHQMGMVFQQFNLLSTKTVYQNVALPLRFIGKTEAEIKTIVMPLLDLVGLFDKANTYPHQLSGGQKQRVAIARALSTNPKILLCDEMTSSLDPETTESILKLVKKINHEFKVTVLLITHEMNVIKQIADRVAVLDKGHIVEESGIVELFSQPKTEVTKALIDAAFKRELPESIRQHLSEAPQVDAHPVLRIEFVGDIAEKPIIDTLTHEFKMRVNILQANLEYIHGVQLGVMILSVYGEESARAIEHLKAQKGIWVEELGFAKL